MNNELDERLRARLTALADEADDRIPIEFGDVSRSIGQRRRRRRAAGSLALTAAVVCGVITVSRVTRDPGDERVATHPAPPLPPANRSWSGAFADAPLGPRWGHPAVMAGGDLLIWGGSDASGQLSDGALYDRSRDVWRPMAQAPISGRAGHAAFWDGQRLVVWGGHTDRGLTVLNDGAFYDPSADRWTVLPPAPLAPRRDMAAAWTGVDLLIYGGSAGDGAATTTFSDGAAFDSESGTWRPLPSSPLGPRSAAMSAVFDGKWLVWGGFQGDQAAYDGAIYDGTTWTRLPDLAEGLPAPAGPVGVWTGEELLAFGRHHSGQVVGVAFRPATSTWRSLASAPFSDLEFTAMVWAGGRLAAWSSDRIFEYDPGSDKWLEPVRSPLSPRSGVSLVWSGTEALVWGGISFRSADRRGMVAFYSDGAAYRPAAGR